MRHRPLLALALGAAALTASAAGFDLAAAPAWQGWSRAGRATELDVRVTSDTATGARLEVSAGNQRVQAALDLQPGRPLRLHVPVAAAERVELVLQSAGGQTRRLQVLLQRSESPLLGVALAAPAALALPGFHVVTLVADDFPRHAAAYAGIDALVVDAALMAALDPERLAALLAHAADCGRVVVVGADERLRRVLEGAGGCGGRALMLAAVPADAPSLLDASLADPLPQPMPAASLGALAPSEPPLWRPVAIGVALYLAAALLTALFAVSWPAQVLLAALATIAALALPRALPAVSQLVIWSEGDSGARSARFQAWQRVVGAAPTRVTLPVAPQLAPSAQACDAAVPVQFTFDADAGQVVSAAFETRLFGQAALCYTGSFAMARALAVTTSGDGATSIRNVGATAWPRGLWLADGRARELPALGPGKAVTWTADAALPAGASISAGPSISAAASVAATASVSAAVPATASAPVAAPALGALERTALTRLRPGRGAALWPLDLAGVAERPSDTRGWLLMAAPAR
ncbi:MAG: hypothetical protein KGL78_12380 [Burkholderiales bacterium]|nr:hypothetical protein [Burkholderiales bacterium]